MRISIRRADIDDAISIIPFLRAHDKKTIAKLQIDAIGLLKATIEAGDPTWVALEGDAPVCMWGMKKKNLLGNWMLWMLTTDLLDQHPIQFLRKSREFMQSAYDEFGTIEGMVDSDFETSVRWLRWLGFKPIAEGEYQRMIYNGH